MEAGNGPNISLLAVLQLLIVVAIGVGLLADTEGLNDGVLSFNIAGQRSVPLAS